MFVQAIEGVSKFTRPIHSITRAWGTTVVEPSSSTLFFVNSDGWALTCKHVAKIILGEDQLKDLYSTFKSEREGLTGGRDNRKAGRALTDKFGFKPGVTIELKNMFINCVDVSSGISVMSHDTYDVALIRFDGFSKLMVDHFPIFAKDGSSLKQGKSICRLGFPFPEFSNFEYNSKQDFITWTSEGRKSTPVFPIEGMLTRFLGDENANVFGFEVSTPGLRGQSGGPAFDNVGRIWGMQSATGHLDLNFDIDRQLLRNGLTHRVKDYAFLHVGHCVHVDVLKAFMREKQVSFAEG